MISNFSLEASISNVYQLDIVRAFPTYIEKVKKIKLPEDKTKYRVEVGKLIKKYPNLRNEIVEYIYKTFLSLLDKYNIDKNEILRFYTDEIIITKPIVLGNEVVIEHDIFKIKQKKIHKYIYTRLINGGFIKIFYDNKIKIDKKTILPYADDFILDLYNSINKRFVIKRYLSGTYPESNYITNYKRHNVVILKKGIFVDKDNYNHVTDNKLIDDKSYYNIAKIYNFLLNQNWRKV